MKTYVVNCFALRISTLALFFISVLSCSPSSLSRDEAGQRSSDIPNNVILYKSTTGTVVVPHDINAFGANIVSNTYSEEGVGRIVFDADLKGIGHGAFMNCDELVSISFPNSIIKMGQSIVSYEVSYEDDQFSDTRYDGVFENCKHLTTINLPQSLSFLSSNMFGNCSLLSNVQLPKAVTVIGEGAFYGCLELKNITIPEGVTFIGDWAFSGAGIRSIQLPKGVTAIGAGLFYDCRDLKTITIPKGVTFIGDYAFYGAGIKTIKLPDSLVYLGARVFYNANDLEPFTLPNSITHILDCTFNDTWTSITLPESITHIGENSFEFKEDGTILHDWTSITIKAKVPPVICGCSCPTYEWVEKGIDAIRYYDYNDDNYYWEKTLFKGNGDYPSGCTIYVPASSVQAYKEAIDWRRYADIIKAIP